MIRFDSRIRRSGCGCGDVREVEFRFLGRFVGNLADLFPFFAFTHARMRLGERRRLIQTKGKANRIITYYFVFIIFILPVIMVVLEIFTVIIIPAAKVADYKKY